MVGGYRLMPWTWGSRDEERAEVKELSGTNEVPILVLDDGEVISGSGTIARWARNTRAARRARAPASRGLGGDQLALAGRVARGERPPACRRGARG